MNLPDETLHAYCIQQGVPVPSHDDRPVVLAGSNTCWYVADGSIDLFTVGLGEDSGLSEIRTYVRTAERGEIVFGIDPAAASTPAIFVVRGSATTQLFVLPIDTLEAERKINEPFAKAVDAWVVHSTAVLCSTHTRKVDEQLVQNQQAGLKPALRYGAAGDVLWIKGCGPLAYCNAVNTIADVIFFPVPPNGWVTPDGEGVVTPLGTSLLIAEQNLGSALGPFNDAVLRGLAGRSDATQSETLARQLHREQRDAELLQNAFGDALVVNRQAGYVAHDLVSTDSLTKAVARLAILFKTTTPRPDRHIEKLETDQRLARLLASANLTSREVQLTGAWWKSDGMPMIAWTKSGQPIVLWSVARRYYSYFDPADGRTGRVDRAFAETLAETAHATYPTLLADRVGPRDLLRTGLRGGMRDVVFVILFGVFAALISLITPSITATLINTAIPESAERMVLELSGVLISVAIVTAIFQFLQATSLLRVETIFESQAQAALWHRLMRMPSKFFRQFNSGNLAVRAMGLSQIRTVLSRGLAGAMLGGLFSFLNFIVMIVYGGWLTLAALVMMILTVAVAVTANIVKVRRLRLAIKAQDDLAGQSVQAIAAIKKLRVAGAEDRLASKLISLHNRQRTYDYAARSIENWLRAYNTVIPLISTAVFFAVVEFLFTDPPATGDFVAFTAAYGSFIVGITGLLNALTMGLTAVVLYERLRPILEAKPEKSVGSLPPGELSGRIEINRVTFRYLTGGRPALDDVSLTVEPGQFVAIVGPSGSGKSTLLRMLLGFERPQSGAILYDGKDLSRLDTDAVRLQFGAILQNMQVLGGSIFENIAGSRALSMDDAWKAAEQASLDQVIKDMPMQMHTVVNDGGTLSGGEKQRLMLARALAGNPKILFMDEATSALDNATQAVVTKSLSALDLTRVVIAHRLSTIKDADVIYVMQSGKIVESGNAKTLLEKGGLFSAFVERQQIEY